MNIPVDYGSRYYLETIMQYYYRLLICFDKAMKKHGIEEKERLEIAKTLLDLWRKEKWNA